MKYVLLGLILLVTSLPGDDTSPSARPLHFYASSLIATSDRTGTTTEVGIYVNTSSSAAQVGISISRYRRSCTAGACQKVTAIDGYTIQRVDAADAHIDRQLRHGYVHATLRLHNGITNRDLAVQADVGWIASAPPVCDTRYDGEECIRVATALEYVSSGTETFLAGQTTPDGQLTWTRPIS